MQVHDEILTGDGTVIQRVTLTPRDAQEILDTQSGSKRAVRSGMVKKIQRDLENHHWIFNGQTISFDQMGLMNNGYHRLTALSRCENGESMDTLIVRGLSAKSVKTMDSGAPRSIPDVLNLYGFDTKSSRTLAMALSFLRQLDTNKVGVRGANASTGVTNAEAVELLNTTYAQLYKSVQWAHVCGTRRLMRLGDLAALHYLFSHRSTWGLGEPEVWLHKLIHGEGIKPDTGLFHLRSRLMNSLLGGRESKVSRREVMALAIKAWNKDNAGDPVRHLAWRKKVESFPKVK
jgi:hypothetical protein